MQQGWIGASGVSTDLEKGSSEGSEKLKVARMTQRTSTHTPGSPITE